MNPAIPAELLLWHRLPLELLRRLAKDLFVPCLGRFVDLRRIGLRSAGFQKCTERFSCKDALSARKGKAFSGTQRSFTRHTTSFPDKELHHLGGLDD